MYFLVPVLDYLIAKTKLQASTNKIKILKDTLVQIFLIVFNSYIKIKGTCVLIPPRQYFRIAAIMGLFAAKDLARFKGFEN